MTHQVVWPQGIEKQDIVPVVPLYKFISLTPVRLSADVELSWRDRISQMLGGQAYLSSPESFNDPFDCLPTVAMPTNQDDFIAKLPHLVARFSKAMPERDRSEIEQLLRDKASANGLEELARVTRESFATSGRGLGVFCLTERVNRVLMWSHYADNHRGIALRFEPLRGITNWEERAQIHSRLLPMFKVRYQEQRARILTFFDRDKGDTDHSDAMIDALRTKAAFWDYEDEWRVIEPDGAHKFKAFDPQIITGIVLGAKTVLEDEAWLRDIAREHGLEVLKVEPDRDTFSLHLKQLLPSAHQ